VRGNDNLPPGVTLNDIDPKLPPECEDCLDNHCPGVFKCPKIQTEPARVDDLGPDE